MFDIVEKYKLQIIIVLLSITICACNVSEKTTPIDMPEKHHKVTQKDKIKIFSRPWLLLECYEDIDPLSLNQETVYTVVVTNQGSAIDYNVKVKIIFPQEILPVSAYGDTECIVDSKYVQMLSYPVVLPKKQIKWCIKARAVKLGSGELRLFLTSKFFKKATVESESTAVFD